MVTEALIYSHVTLSGIYNKSRASTPSLIVCLALLFLLWITM